MGTFFWLTRYTKILKVSTVPCTKIMKINTVPYTYIWKNDALPDGTFPYPKYMKYTRGDSAKTKSTDMKMFDVLGGKSIQVCQFHRLVSGFCNVQSFVNWSLP